MILTLSLDSGIRRTGACRGGNPVAHVPELPESHELHALLEDLHGRSPGSDHAAADDALRQLEMQKAEELQLFVKIHHALGHIVQAEEFVVTQVDVVDAHALPLQ